MSSPPAPAESQVAEDERGVHCRVTADFFQPAARAMIGTLSRGFLDQMVLTPTEVLFSARNHSRIDGAGTLLRDIIDRTAKMQATAANMPWQARQREIQAMIDVLVLKVRELEQAEPSIPLKPGMARATFAQVRAASAPELRPYRIYRILTEHLANTRVWTDKFNRLMLLADELIGTPDFQLVDELLAEAVAGEVAQDALFGRRISNEARLEDLIALYRGRLLAHRNGQLPQLAAALDELLAKAPTPILRASVEAAITQIIAQRNPLSSQELLIELRACANILGRLREGDRVIGGRRTLEFMDRRQGRILSPDTLSDYVRGAATLLERLTALFEIHAVTFGPSNRRLVEAAIARWMNDDDFDRRLLQGEASPAQKLRMATTLWRLVANSGLDRLVKQTWGQKLVRLQASFIQHSRFFATFERQNVSTARKVQQLLTLCTEGHFIPGENLNRVRALIGHYMKRPDFFDQLGEGVSNPAARAELVTQMNAQLAQLELPALSR
jgi:hypothetical protein